MVKAVVLKRNIQVSTCVDGDGRLARLIVLNRHGKLNCLNLNLLGELRSAIEDAGELPIVLTGAGRAFCSGLDLNEAGKSDCAAQMVTRLVAIYKLLLSHSKPVVVLARGFAVGGGMGLALCAYHLVVAEDLKFRLPAGNLGRLARVVEPLCAMRASKTTPAAGWAGCELDAAGAVKVGLANQLVPMTEWDNPAKMISTLAINSISLSGRNREASARAFAQWDEYLKDFSG